MFSIIELYNLIARRYLNRYKKYINNIDDRTILKYNLLHRTYIYYEILELIYDNINEQGS